MQNEIPSGRGRRAVGQQAKVRPALCPRVQARKGPGSGLGPASAGRPWVCLREASGLHDSNPRSHLKAAAVGRETLVTEPLRRTA